MGNEVEVFDLQRMFLGDLSPWFLLEVAFRTTFMFAYTLILVRLTGKRGMGEVTPFELLLVVALGSAVGDPMFYPDVPLFHAMLVVAVIVLLQQAMSVMLDHSKTAERMLESTSTRLVADGVIDLPAMRAEHFSNEELFMLLREEGVEQLGQVKRAYLEPSGRLSAWLFSKEDVEPGLPILPADDPEYPSPLPAEHLATEDGTFACLACGTPVDVAAGEALGTCPECDCKDGWLAASFDSGRDSAESGGRHRHPRRGVLGR